MNIVEEGARRLSPKRSHGRVINAIAAMLRQRLSVPHIYFKPRLLGYSTLDVLAVDRAGSGDVHGVEIKVVSIVPSPASIKKLLVPLRSLPVHYKYLALNSRDIDINVLRKLANYPELFDDTGIGRVGIIAYDDRLLQADTTLNSDLTTLVVSPERFLVRDGKLTMLERFLVHAKPDMQVRM
jgi:hypothetical protein